MAGVAGLPIKLHFIPSYCPHLNPIERLWGLMHRNVTHNRCYATCAKFADATLGFLREQVPRNWARFCDSVTDNFRAIAPKDVNWVYLNPRELSMQPAWISPSESRHAIQTWPFTSSRYE